MNHLTLRDYYKPTTYWTFPGPFCVICKHYLPGGVLPLFKHLKGLSGNPLIGGNVRMCDICCGMASTASIIGPEIVTGLQRPLWALLNQLNQSETHTCPKSKCAKRIGYVSNDQMFVVPVNYPFNEFWDKPLPLLLNVAHYPPLHVFCFIPIFSGLLDGFVAKPHHVGLIVLTFRKSGSKARIMRKITENLPKTMFVQRIFCGLLVSVPESKKKKKKIQT